MNNETISYLILLVGCALLAGGAYAYFRQRARLAQSLITDGVVIDLVPLRATSDYIRKKTAQGMKLERKTLYRPLVRFRTTTGRAVEFMAALSSRPAAFEIGDCVEVIYQPDNPEQAQINSFFYLWFNVANLVFWGIFFLAMGYLGIILFPG